jgi:hypothetical protein
VFAVGVELQFLLAGCPGEELLGVLAAAGDDAVELTRRHVPGLAQGRSAKYSVDGDRPGKVRDPRPARSGALPASSFPMNDSADPHSSRRTGVLRRWADGSRAGPAAKTLAG